MHKPKFLAFTQINNINPSQNINKSNFFLFMPEWSYGKFSNSLEIERSQVLGCALFQAEMGNKQNHQPAMTKYDWPLPPV
jgi:hypothetical protein